MGVLICGGRNFSDVRLLQRTLDDLHAKRGFTMVIHGMAKGADTLAGEWARRNRIEVRPFRADWKRYGNRDSGPIRNRQMLVEGRPDLVIAFKGGRGTKNMIEQTQKGSVPLLVIDESHHSPSIISTD